MADQRLSGKMLAFALYVVEGESGPDAIIKAGYKVANRAVARSMASEYLAKPIIADFIREQREKIIEQSELQTVQIVDELRSIAFSNIVVVLKALGPEGVGDNFTKDVAALPEEIQKSIAEIQKTKEGWRVKLHNKLDALQLLGNWKQMWKESYTLSFEDVQGKLAEIHQVVCEELERHCDRETANTIKAAIGKRLAAGG
jgi:phage terminase small subunit